MPSFNLAGTDIEYYGGKNAPTSERCVEVALGLWFVRTYNPSVLEIGNVTRAHRGEHDHLTIDLHEERLGWTNYYNEDVFTYEPPKKFDGVLSISSLEHTDDPRAAIIRVLSWSDNVLITIPFGYRSNDQQCGSSKVIMSYRDWLPVPPLFMRKTAQGFNWEEVTEDEIRDMSDAELAWNGQYPMTASAIAIVRKGWPWQEKPE